MYPAVTCQTTGCSVGSIPPSAYQLLSSGTNNTAFTLCPAIDPTRTYVCNTQIDSFARCPFLRSIVCANIGLRSSGGSGYIAVYNKETGLEEIPSLDIPYRVATRLPGP